jgi:hypothetical protein
MVHRKHLADQGNVYLLSYSTSAKSRIYTGESMIFLNLNQLVLQSKGHG